MMSIRSFNYSTEEDYIFTYEILKRRYSNSISLIEGITPSVLPSYEEHKRKVREGFPVLQIALFNNNPIGIGYIDTNNRVGFFYHFTKLKNVLKETKTKNLDLSKFYLKSVLTLGGNRRLTAFVSINNKLANRTASRLMKFESSTETYNIYSYTNE